MKKNVFSFLTIAFLTCASALQAEVKYLSGSSKVQLKDAPPAVQNAIKAEAGSAKVEDLERGTLDGRTVFEAAFKRGGQHTELRVAEDGTVVDTIVAGASQGAKQGAAATAKSATSKPAQAFEAGFDAHLSGSKKVSFKDVPAEVQKVIKERAGSAKVEDVEKGTISGKTHYQAAYKKNGKHTELQVSEDGKLVREYAGGSTVYSTYAWQAGFNNQLSGSKVVKMEDIPENIRNTIKSRLGSAKIETVRQGTVSGKQVYQIGYNENSQHGEFRIAQDGQFFKQVLGGKVVNESAGAEAGKLK